MSHICILDWSFDKFMIWLINGLIWLIIWFGETINLTLKFSSLEAVPKWIPLHIWFPCEAIISHRRLWQKNQYKPQSIEADIFSVGGLSQQAVGLAIYYLLFVSIETHQSQQRAASCSKGTPVRLGDLDPSPL